MHNLLGKEIETRSQQGIQATTANMIWTTNKILPRIAGNKIPELKFRNAELTCSTCKANKTSTMLCVLQGLT